jgi:hypothetical protein
MAAFSLDADCLLLLLPSLLLQVHYALHVSSIITVLLGVATRKHLGARRKQHVHRRGSVPQHTSSSALPAALVGPGAHWLLLEGTVTRSGGVQTHAAGGWLGCL